eukprot:COSAG02_NODE_831_length_16662_cov_25.818270_3_plen_75_part_00
MMVSQAGSACRVETVLISLEIREKNKRLEAVRGAHCIYQCILRTPNDSNPACETMAEMMAEMVAEMMAEKMVVV